MKMSLVATCLIATLLVCRCALAQVGGIAPSPLNASPLAGPTAPVGPVGIPLGAMELPVPGLSPPPTATTGCATTGAAVSQMGTPLFDGGSMAGAAGCAQSGTTDGAASMPSPPPLQAGRAGIPLGSSETADPGISAPPPLTAPFVSPIAPPVATTTTPSVMAAPSAPLMPPCPVTGTFSGQSTLRGDRTNAAGGTAPPLGC